MLSFKRQQDLDINSEAVESVSIEILNKKCKNIIVNTIYRPRHGDIEAILSYLFAKNDTVNKHIVLTGNFNLNVLDFENNKKVENFVWYQTENTATAINYIITNVIIDTNFKTGILKSCISDHFAIMLAFWTGEKKMCNKSEQHIHKRIFNENTIESFRLRLRKVKWDNLKTSNDSNLAYNEFLDTFTTLYDDCFLRVKIKVKDQNSFKRWITKGIGKSSKKNKKYKKYLKNNDSETLAMYKTYKNLFETIKKKIKEKLLLRKDPKL